jgi:hypothetical protein
VLEDIGDFSSMEWLATARHEEQQNLSFFSNPRSNAYIFNPGKFMHFQIDLLIGLKMRSAGK